MNRLDDPALVAAEYADEARLRKRASVFTPAGTSADARMPAVRAVVEARPRGELARVLAPGGRVVAVTNSRHHLQELRDLVGSGPSPSTFTREDGAELLRRHFTAVRREDVDGVVELADRAAVEDYVRASISMSAFVGNMPTGVVEPFLARSWVSVFVAENAA